MERLCRFCKGNYQSWNCQIHHAVDKQPCNNLLQPCSFRHRRRYLYLRHDDCIECPSARGDPDLRDHRGLLPDFRLQLWSQTSCACEECRCGHGTFDSRLHRYYVELYHPDSGYLDPCFQFRRTAGTGFCSCSETIFCRIYLYGFAIPRSDRI